MTPPYNGWYETYEFKFYDLLIKADNLNCCLSSICCHCEPVRLSGVAIPRPHGTR